MVDGRKNKTKIARVKKPSRCSIPTENEETENRSLSSVVQRGQRGAARGLSEAGAALQAPNVSRQESSGKRETRERALRSRRNQTRNGPGAEHARGKPALSGSSTRILARTREGQKNAGRQPIGKEGERGVGGRGGGMPPLAGIEGGSGEAVSSGDRNKIGLPPCLAKARAFLRAEDLHHVGCSGSAKVSELCMQVRSIILEAPRAGI